MRRMRKRVHRLLVPWIRMRPLHWSGGGAASVCAYGHPARKATWLYVDGLTPLPLDWGSPAPTATVSYLTNHRGGELPRLTKKQARRTPEAFRDVLIKIVSEAA